MGEVILASLLLQAMRVAGAAGALVEMEALLRPPEALGVEAEAVLVETVEMSLARPVIRLAAVEAEGAASDPAPPWECSQI
jgi:hypothetical protein